MATPKEEKLLSSIDGTLKDILKELKRQGRERSITHVTIDTDAFSDSDIEELKRTRVLDFNDIRKG